MKPILKTLTIGLLMALVCATAYADDYADTKKMFVDAGIGDMFNSAYGYALFPTGEWHSNDTGAALTAKAVFMSRASISAIPR